MSDDMLKKIIVTVIAITIFVMWNLAKHHYPDCTINCVTDFSATRK